MEERAALKHSGLSVQRSIAIELATTEVKDAGGA